MFYNNKWIIRLTSIFIALFCAIILGVATVAYAQSSSGFSVQAIIPDNQIDTRQTYFDLRLQPGEKQSVEVVVNNSRDEELVAEVRLNAASTGRNGLIAYTESNVRDESMKVSITDVASIQSERVIVPARDSKKLAIDIKMPEDPIQGVILGGITITGSEAGQDAPTTQGISLNNKITYVIALKITQSDSVEAANFDLAAITPELVNYKTAVVATLQNKAARIVKGMVVKAQVFRKGSDSVLHELVINSAEMAPLSKGDFAIDWENQPLDEGTYRLRMTADYDGKTWEWDEEFTIGAEAGDLNNAAMGLIKNNIWIYVLLGVIALMAICIVAYRSRRRRKPDEGILT